MYSINLSVIDFSRVLAIAEIDIINDLLAMDLLQDIKFTNRDVKSAFYFHIIKHYYDNVVAAKHKSKVYYFSSCDSKDLELNEYVNHTRLVSFLTTVLKHLNTALPATLYMGSICYDTLVDKSNNTGEVVETRNNIEAAYKFRKIIPSFQKIKKFIHDKQFTWLEKNYFKDPNHLLSFYK